MLQPHGIEPPSSTFKDTRRSRGMLSQKFPCLIRKRRWYNLAELRTGWWAVSRVGTRGANIRALCGLICWQCICCTGMIHFYAFKNVNQTFTVIRMVLNLKRLAPRRYPASRIGSQTGTHRFCSGKRLLTRQAVTESMFQLIKVLR